MVGHWGVERTITLIEQLLKREPSLLANDDQWLNLRQNVKHCVSHCGICQKLKYHRLVTKTQRYTTSTYGIMDNLSIDGLKMPEECSRGLQMGYCYH